MGTTSRRGFLKGFGFSLSLIAVTGNVDTVVETLDLAQSTLAAPDPASSHPSATYLAAPVRGAISRGELEILVAELLSQWTAERQTFTAYDVTQVLRVEHPAVNILHQYVRSIVHRRMAPAIASAVYSMEQVWFATGSACCYRPSTT
jgi:hypothetical protein